MSPRLLRRGVGLPSDLQLSSEHALIQCRRQFTYGGKNNGESSRVPVLLKRETASLDGGCCLNKPF